MDRLLEFLNNKGVVLLTINPFSTLSETIPAIAIQTFVIVMGLLVVIGTLVDIIHKKNVKYFFENARKLKTQQRKYLLQAKKLQLL